MRMRQRTRSLSLRRHIAPRRSRRAPVDAWERRPGGRIRGRVRRRDGGTLGPKFAGAGAGAGDRHSDGCPSGEPAPRRGALRRRSRSALHLYASRACHRATLGSTSPCARPRIVCTAKEDAIVDAAAHGGHGSELNRYTAAAVYSSTGISGRRGGLEAEVLPALPVEHVRARHLLRVVLGELGRFTLRDSVRFSEMLVDSPCAITDIMMGTLHQAMGAGR